MAYGARYRIPFLNPGIGDGECQHFSVVIEERDYTGSETVLKGDPDALVLRYLDNNEDKYAPIQASEVDISFYSENNFSLDEIFTGDDFQFRVIIYIGDYKTGEIFPVWYGFISPDDCTEPMQSDPKLIRLRATDGLAFLRGQVLYDISVYEKKQVLNIINHALSFTGLGIDLLLEVNVFEENMSDRDDGVINDPLSQCKIHTRSFLKNDNTYIDCYSALEKIMTSFKASLFQYNGKWQIQRKHDRWNSNIKYGTLWHYSLVAVPPIILPAPIILPTQEDYTFPINRTTSTPINVDHIKGFSSKVKYSQLNYSYETPKQLPRNSNFQQGDFYAPVSGVNNTATRINYWTYKNFKGDPKSIIPYRNQVFDTETGLLSDSYIVLPNLGETWEPNYLESEPVEISKGDRMGFSCDLKQRFVNNNVSNSVVEVYIKGDDGSDWYFHDYIGDEYLSGNNPRWINAREAVQLFYSEEENVTDWKSVEFRTEPFPVDGLLYVRFFSDSHDDNSLVLANEKWYRAVKYEWQFFINSTTRINGEYDKISANDLSRKNKEEDVFISDAPKKSINGALFLYSDESKLTAKWHRQGKDEFENLIRINDIALYQASHRLYTKIDGSFLGITYNNRIIGPPTQFTFSAIPNKVFISTNLEISLGQNTFRASLQEFYDTTKDNGDPQGDSRQFEYVYE